MLLCEIEKALTKQIELSETAFVYYKGILNNHKNENSDICQ